MATEIYDINAFLNRENAQNVQYFDTQFEPMRYFTTRTALIFFELGPDDSTKYQLIKDMNPLMKRWWLMKRIYNSPVKG